MSDSIITVSDKVIVPTTQEDAELCLLKSNALESELAKASLEIKYLRRQNARLRLQNSRYLERQNEEVENKESERISVSLLCGVCFFAGVAATILFEVILIAFSLR